MATDPMMTMRILWGSFLSTPILFAIGLRTMLPNPGAPTPPNPTVGVVLPIVALVLACALPLARYQLMGGTLAISPTSADEDLSGVPQRSIARYQTGLIVSMAICEAVSLIGFAHGFDTGSAASMLPYVALSMLLMLPMIPTASGVRLVR